MNQISGGKSQRRCFFIFTDIVVYVGAKTSTTYAFKDFIRIADIVKLEPTSGGDGGPGTVGLLPCPCSSAVHRVEEAECRSRV